MNRSYAAISALLSLELAVSLCWGETVGRLNLIVVDGGSAINDLRQRTPRTASVRVEDESGKPVAGAAVAFTLPEQGATGTFSGGSKMLATMTDEKGMASARILNPTGSGNMEIRVNASYQGRMGSTFISQVNMAVPSAKKSGSKWIALAVILAGAGVGGALALTHSKSNTPAVAASVPIGISPGAGSIGPPK